MSTEKRGGSAALIGCGSVLLFEVFVGSRRGDRPFPFDRALLLKKRAAPSAARLSVVRVSLCSVRLSMM